MELIENKRVGKVLLIVEGSKHEFSLMKKIFVDVLGYTQIEKRREREEYYVREGDKHSIVAVVNTKHLIFRQLIVKNIWIKYMKS